MKGLFSLQGIRFGSPQLIDGHISIAACSKQKFAHCPCCKKRSKRIHSSYVRTLRDLPFSIHSVSINFTARKFFCQNTACEKKIFTEQPDPEISAYSRMTNRTRMILRDLFLEVSAQKGSYLSRIISLPVSPSTGLRLVASLPISSTEEVRVLGIDDWANRKGISYGTILVNIETGQVIDLLTERDGVSLKKWLNCHPEVEIVTRDRASAYSCAVTATLPNAIQVADRFHLLKNFSDCIYDVIRIEYKNLNNCLKEDLSPPGETKPPDIPEKESGEIPLKEKGEMNDHFKDRFEKVKEMLKEGYKIKAIARSLNMSRNTVRCYSEMDFLPKKGIHLRNNYYEYHDIIENELSEGKSLRQVFEKIKEAGFKGSHTSFYEQYKNNPKRSNPENKIITPAKPSLISPRKISRYLQMADLSKIQDNTERKIMQSLLSKNEMLQKLSNQALAFKAMLLGNDDSMLDDWIKETLVLEKSRLKTFIRGLLIDMDAVRNAIKTNWSNGQVEGQVNRLKSIKRQMYGRAGFELLRRKVILSNAG